MVMALPIAGVRIDVRGDFRSGDWRLNVGAHEPPQKLLQLMPRLQRTLRIRASLSDAINTPKSNTPLGVGFRRRCLNFNPECAKILLLICPDPVTSRISPPRSQRRHRSPNG